MPKEKILKTVKKIDCSMRGLFVTILITDKHIGLLMLPYMSRRAQTKGQIDKWMLPT